LGEAIAHYGKILKTLHILTLVEDPRIGGKYSGDATFRNNATALAARCSTAATARCIGRTSTAWKINSARSALFELHHAVEPPAQRAETH
jgi:hypothetical protein